MPTAQRPLNQWVATLMAAGLCVWIACATPHWLAMLLPLQKAMLQWVAPELAVTSMQLHPDHWLLMIEVSTRQHEVLQGRAWPAGLELQAQTPARLAQRLAVLCAAGIVWWCWRRPAPSPLKWGLWAGWTALLATSLPPIVLLGQLWAVGIGDASEASARQLLVMALRFVLNGGDVLLIGVAYMVLSNHAGFPPRPVPPSRQPGRAAS